MSLYIIGIGGTGAKCIEAVTKLAAVGLFPEQPSIKVLFIDPDETNGNLDRARSSLKIYQKCYELMFGDKKQSPWMQTEIASFDLWSPFSQTSTNKNLASFFSYNSLKQNEPALGNLFDILYTKGEREVDLDLGFRGRPAIGSGIMSQVDLDSLDQEPWGALLKQIKADVGWGKSPKILLCGSIFGGTGASGLPTIGRLIANKLEKLNVRSGCKIGCLFVLPYFRFSPPVGEDLDGVYARSELFLLNTEAALRYYVTQSQQTFDTVYLLGNQNFSEVKFSIGKNTQRNEPHFLELYAGLAARQFLLSSPSERGAVVLISRQEMGSLTWSDIPEMSTVKSQLVNATRFAYAWLANTVPELAGVQKNGVNWGQKNIVWFSRFFRPNQGILGKIFDKKGEDLPDFTDEREQEAIKIISSWCKDYLRWLYDLHQCEGDNIELFMSQLFANPDGQLSQDDFFNLAISDSRDQGKQSQDTIPRLNAKLASEPKDITPPNHGTAGIAKALYILCKL